MIYNSTTNTSYLRAPEYAPRHAHLFTDYSIPRDENVNTQTDGAVGWIEDLKPLNETVLAYNEEYQRSRLRALQAVDEMVESVVEKLVSDCSPLYVLFCCFSKVSLLEENELIRASPCRRRPGRWTIRISFIRRTTGIILASTG